MARYSEFWYDFEGRTIVSKKLVCTIRKVRLVWYNYNSSKEKESDRRENFSTMTNLWVRHVVRQSPLLGVFRKLLFVSVNNLWNACRNSLYCGRVIHYTSANQTTSYLSIMICLYLHKILSWFLDQYVSKSHKRLTQKCNKCIKSFLCVFA